MYCRRCGKKMEYEGDICNECNSFDSFFEAPKQETPQVTYTQNTYSQSSYSQPSKPAQRGSVMEGFKKALAATIMAVFASAFFMVACEIVSASGNYIEETMSTCIPLFIIALGLSIPSLIMGIASIKLFKEQKELGRKKPIPALILGINAVVNSAFALLFSVIFLLMFMDGGL